jgi:hypothetical protein
LQGGLGVAALLVVLGATWILSLPSTPAAKAVPLIAADEADAMIAALRPPKRQRPLIAILGSEPEQVLHPSDVRGWNV